MKTRTYKIRGMHCASCAGIIEKTLKKVDGVHSAEVNYGTESARVTFDHAKTDHQALRIKWRRSDILSWPLPRIWACPQTSMLHIRARTSQRRRSLPRFETWGQR
ncbi:MAG: heavy metal-associated domain-containing protein [Candidatus Paceibacterota bacterium]